MATQPEIRVGVIGAGALGYHHVRILRDVPGARLVGFFESRPERASAVAQELGVRSFDRLDSLLDAIDAATVVVPTPVHYEVAKAALARGKHLLIEKPIAATLSEADELLALAKRTGALIQTGHVERFNRAIRAALPHVEKARFIESDRLAPFNPRGADVAVVLDLMIHRGSACGKYGSSRRVGICRSISRRAKESSFACDAMSISPSWRKGRRRSKRSSRGCHSSRRMASHSDWSSRAFWMRCEARLR